MADILIVKDANTLVPKLGISDSERTNWLKTYAIYDINADGSKTGPTGPTNVALKTVDALVKVNDSGAPTVVVTREGQELGTSTTFGPSISGTPGVGNVLTAVPPSGWSASGWQWYRNGTAISGATSQTYTQVDADAEAQITVAGSGWVVLSMLGVTVPKPPFPTPLNNLIALDGDSRSDSSSLIGNSSITQQLCTTGYAPFLLAAVGYRVEIVDNYASAGVGVNSNLAQQTDVALITTNIAKGYILSGITPGTAVGATTDTAGYANGLAAGSPIGIAAAGTGSINVGDAISIGSNYYKVATGLANVASGGSITLTTQLRAAIPASATGVTIRTRPPTTAGAILKLAGVNGVRFGTGGVAADAGTPWLGTNGVKQNIDAQLAGYKAANKIVLLCDELPINGDTTSGATVPALQRERRDNLRLYSDTNIVKLPTWNAAAAAPDSDLNRAGYSLNLGNSTTTWHYTIRGYRGIAEEGMAPVINAMYAGYPVRNQLPAGANSAGYLWSSDMTGTGTGTGITSGNVPAGFTATFSTVDGLSCAMSQVVNAEGFTELVVRIFGTGTAAANTRRTLQINRLLDASGALNGITPGAGDRIFTVARVKVDAGNTGLLACFPRVSASTNVPSFSQVGDGGTIYGSVFGYEGDFGGVAMDYPLLSQPVTLPTGWAGGTSKTIQSTLPISYWADRAVDFTVRISRMGAVANR